MIEQVWEQIEKYRMIEENDRVLAGVSGGADSVCLLFVLRELQKRRPFELSVLHVEHGIRGGESLEDARFVETLCGELNVPFECVHADVPAAAKERGLSVEEAGRVLRYDAFEAAAERLGGAKIAVAHNRNDNAETVLLNLFRGTGIKGMCGIPPVRGNIIRPLLAVTRKEIEEYLASIGAAYREDATNDSDDYTRNRIRRHILPLAEQEINPKAVSHLSESAGLLRETEEYLCDEARKLYAECAVRRDEDSIRIFLPRFHGAALILKRYVLRLCVEALADGLKDVTKSHMDAVLALCEGATGKRAVLPGGLFAEKSYGYLIISRAPYEKKSEEAVHETPAAVFFEPETGTIHETEFGGFCFRGRVLDRKENEKIPDKSYTKWFDYDIIKNTVQIRTRRPGDYLVIGRDGGRQKLKEWFINEKIPQGERDSVPLVAAGSHVLWAVGYRMDESCKVTDSTRRILAVQAEKRTPSEHEQR